MTALYPDFVLDEDFTREVRKALGVDDGLVAIPGTTTITVGQPMPFYIGEKLTLDDGREFEVVGPGLKHDKNVLVFVTSYGGAILVRPVVRIDPVGEAFVDLDFEPSPRAPIVREISPHRSASAPFSTLHQMGYWLNQCGRRVA